MENKQIQIPEEIIEKKKELIAIDERYKIVAPDLCCFKYNEERAVVLLLNPDHAYAVYGAKCILDKTAGVCYLDSPIKKLYLTIGPFNNYDGPLDFIELYKVYKMTQEIREMLKRKNKLCFELEETLPF